MVVPFIFVEKAMFQMAAKCIFEGALTMVPHCFLGAKWSSSIHSIQAEALSAARRSRRGHGRSWQLSHQLLLGGV